MGQDVIDPATILGKTESTGLEFKSAAALEDLPSIARAVVAMLNAGTHGIVWIGVTESSERATGFEDISGADEQKRRLHDHLVDVVEPAPRSEIEVEVVQVGGQHVLRVTVDASQRGSRRAYAQRQGAWRGFPIRVGARTRSMTREEIAEAFRLESDTSVAAKGRGGASRDRFKDLSDAEIAEGSPRLWVALAPSFEAALDQEYRARFATIMADPAASGNRAMGWNPCTEYQQVQRQPNKFVVGGKDSYTWTELSDDLTLVFRAPASRLEHKHAGEIWPYAFVEYIVSTVRVFSTILRDRVPEPRADQDVSVDAGLVQVGKLRLRPGSPRSFRFQFADDEALRKPGEDSFRAGPLDVDAREILERPDGVGWSLTRRLYEAFGLWEDDMPRDIYDRDRAVVSLPRQ